MRSSQREPVKRMHERSKPVRLVMINSGKFNYGEVDLSSPVHLVGPNNVGKTTLISTLQFLYIDQQNQMSFSRSMDETRKYYFPGTDSYILFECLTPTGFMVLGVRGLGVLKQNEFQRFVFRGTYEKSNFIEAESGNIRPFDEVSRDLSARDFANLKPSELRDSLTGTGRSDIPILGIVPVKNRNDYDKFKKIFRNLLHLSHLSQEELKKFMIDVNSSDLNRVEVDLAKDFSEGYRKVQKNARTLSDLKIHSETALKILGFESKRKLLREELPPLYTALINSVDRKKTDLRRQIESLAVKLEELSRNEKEQGEAFRVLGQELGDCQRKTGALESRLEEHRNLGASLSGYLDDFEESRIRQIQTQITKVDVSLRDAAEGDPERIRRRIRGNEDEYNQLSTQFKNVNNLAVSAYPDLSQNVVSALALFNQDILKLPKGDDGIELNNEGKFFAILENLGGSINDKSYDDNGLYINLSSIPAPDLKSLTDREVLSREIADISDLLVKERSVLKAIEERQGLESDRETLLNELKVMKKRRDDWERFSGNTEAALKWEEELTNIVARTEELSSRQMDIELSRKCIDENRRGIGRDRDQTIGSLSLIEKKTAQLPDPEEEWMQSAVLETEYDTLELIEVFQKCYDEMKLLSVRIRDNLSALEVATYEEYKAAEEEEALRKLQEDIDAIDEKEAALKKLWAGLASDVSQAMKSLLTSLDVLKQKVSNLNNRLVKVSVSDLKQLKLVLTENTQWTRLVRTGIEADDMPLFSDRLQVERALESLGSLLKTAGGGRIELKDMFNLSFEIMDVSGVTRKFQRLENIESNGTTITIKILVNIILLRDLLPDNRAQIPFYLDEASSLDRDNLASVVDTAFELGFPAVIASPEAVDVADRIYFMKDTQGKVYLDPDYSCVKLNRNSEKQV
jgi:hypothetical protein